MAIKVSISEAMTTLLSTRRRASTAIRNVTHFNLHVELTRLIQAVESASLGEMPVSLHHSGLDDFHLALCQRLCLVVTARLVAGVVSELRTIDENIK